MDDYAKIKEYYDKSYGNRQKELYNYYMGDAPIKNRKPVSQLKAATHVNMHINFLKDVTEIKVGYMGSNINPSVNIEDEDLKDTVLMELKKYIRSNNNMSQIIRLAAIQGISHLLMYTQDGDLYSKVLPGDEVVYEYDHDIYRPKKAYYYFATEDMYGNKTKYCHVYDNKTITYLKMVGEAYAQYDDVQLHNFNEIPIIPFLNNDMMLSDCEFSKSIMDEYDKVLSDITAEILSVRLAYLKIWGQIYTGKDLNNKDIDVNTWMTQTSKILFKQSPDGKPLGDAQFLEKNINDEATQNELNNLRKHIYEMSGSIDLQDITKAERVVSIKALMQRLEQNCSNTERLIRSGLYKFNRLFAYYLSIKSIPVETSDIDWVFKRKFIRDLQEEAQTLATLSTIITIEDALNQLGWDDADEISYRADQKIENEMNQDLGDNNING